MMNHSKKTAAAIGLSFALAVSGCAAKTQTERSFDSTGKDGSLIMGVIQEVSDSPIQDVDILCAKTGDSEEYYGRRTTCKPTEFFDRDREIHDARGYEAVGSILISRCFIDDAGEIQFTRYFDVPSEKHVSDALDRVEEYRPTLVRDPSITIENIPCVTTYNVSRLSMERWLGEYIGNTSIKYDRPILVQLDAGAY